MNVQLPLIGRSQIVRELRLGAGKTDSAVLKTLRKNGAISKGVRAPATGTNGKLLGSRQFYCSLNRDAALAFRRKDVDLAASYARAAARVEALSSTRELVRKLGVGQVDSSSAALAAALSTTKLHGLATKVLSAIETERQKLPQLGVTTLTGTVISLASDGALIELAEGGARLPIPRTILDEEGLGRVGARLAACWQMAGDGMMIMAVEPTMETSDQVAGEQRVDMYGTPWGKVLTDSDAIFAQSLLDRPASQKRPRRPRAHVTIGE